MRRGNGGEITSTTGLQHLPALYLRVVLDRNSTRRAHRSGAGQARATLLSKGRGMTQPHATVASKIHPSATLSEEPEVEVALG